ncbi:MAG: T9SS type A sorting domain-containing protein [Bacteroidales bacterium]|nr:T9SS type A sorting domain-containing protein [Bacteroidales bacterium]MCF8455724.1 T9SS type A sorting domain-containing protein [Bacteroidales bacterium]
MKRLNLFFFSLITITTTCFGQNFEAINISSNLVSPNMVETVDLNGDSLDDILVAGNEKLYWYENQGNAQFVKHSLVDSIQGFFRFSLFDWENDGDPDIFFTTFTYGNQQVAWLENDGYQNFTYHLINDTILGPSNVRAFDIDKDNDPDILVSSGETDELYWLNNNGMGSFTIDTIGNFVNHFEIADLDGDNDWDIIFGRAYTGITISEVRAFQNDGNNNFSMITLKTGFSTISEIIVEDVNGDNYFDIVVPDYNGDMLSWLKNDGNYGFASKITIMNNFDGPTGVAVKDVNEDGKMDIIAGSYNADQMYYFQGIGSTSSYSFSSGTLIYDGLSMISDLAIGNFDNQNHKDFVHTDKGYDLLSVWTNNGSETFTQNQLAFSFDSPRAFDMKDLDGDGDQDIAAVSNDGDLVAWMENLGNDVFETHILLSNYEEPYVVRINDLDDDGDYDIVAASNDDDRVTWWQNDGAGNFTMSHITTNINAPRDLWIEDFDGDGDKDIAVICYWLSSQSGNTGAQWLKNDGNENFTLLEIDEDVRAGRSMQGADMNGDSLVDVVISSYYYISSKLRIAANNGNGFGIVPLGDLNCEEFEIVDFDGDNDNDILAVDFSLDSIYFYENLGNWQFDRHTIAWYQDLYKISVLDFDQDNDLDIVFSTGKDAFTNGSYYGLGIFRNNGSGNFITETWYQNQTIIKPMEVFDYEEDGDYDMVAGYDYSDKITLYKNLEINCPLSVDAIANGSTGFCEGGSVQLEAVTTDTAITYQWFKDNVPLPNDTSAFLVVIESGLYRVQVADTSCSATSASIEVVVFPAWAEEVYATLCMGDSLVVDTVVISSAGDYILNMQSQWGCDSTVLMHVSMANTYSISFNEEICEGDIFDFNGTMLTQSGTYFDTLQTILGCDSVLALSLTVNPVFSTSLSEEICEGDIFDFNGSILTQSGTYFDTLQTIHGCDSVLALSVTVNPIFSTSLSEEICEGDIFDFNGTMLTQSGTYFDTLQTILGCDSVLALSLTVNPVFSTLLSEEICEGDVFDFNGSMLTQSGTYFDTLQTIHGCDSVLALSLTVNPIFSTPLSEEICEGDIFDFNGTMLTQTGTYFDTLQTITGCDSVLSLSLIVNPIFSTSLSEEICEGEIFDFNGTMLTQSGTYFDTLQTIQGCDSVLALSLTVNPIFSTLLSEEICEGDFFDFNGTMLTQSGTYFDTLQTILGCDSVLSLSLIVNPIFSTSLSEEICEGDIFDFNGTILTQSGTYFDTLQTIHGCDSVLALSLTVDPIFSTPLSDEVCEGDMFDFNGTMLTQSGFYFDTLQTILGCDSVLELVLTVNPVFSTPLSEEICEGDIFDFNGAMLTQSGTYFDTLQTILGCDSVLELSLMVNPIFSTSLSEEICEGDMFDFNGTLLTQSGTYFDTLQTVLGCDSVLELSLTVNPLPIPNLGNDTTIYDNDSITLNPGAFVSYFWQDGSIDASFLVEGPVLGEGTYLFSVEVLNGYLCSNSDTIEVVIIENERVEDFNPGAIFIYPNPVSSSLIIQLKENRNFEMKLFDATGRMILSKALSGQYNRIDVSHLQAGEYLLRLSFENTIKTVPILKAN